MNKSKQFYFSLTFILLLVSSLSVRVSAQEDLEIAGMPVRVIKEMKSAFKTQFIEVVIGNDHYSKDNLLKVWRYYCEKYSDKKVRLDLRVFTQETYEFNRQFDGLPLDMHSWEVIKPDKTRVKLRSFEANFERMGKGALAYGGDNELLIYCPDPAKPIEKIRVVLAGEDPYLQ
jgi:hypothetical protein